MGKNQPQASNLPSAVFDYFGKATVLHGYVLENLTTAAGHAYEAGKMLLAAKAAMPHGRWEEECTKHFAPSLKTAQRYMALAKHVDLLPKTQRSSIFYLEATIDGATKVAKNLATGKPPYDAPQADEPPPAGTKVHGAPFDTEGGNSSDNDSVPFDEDTPSDAPETPEDASDDGGAVDRPEEPETPAKGKQTPPKQYDRSDWLKQWDNSIGPLVRLVDKIANNVGESHCTRHRKVHEYLNHATEEITEWMGE